MDDWKNSRCFRIDKNMIGEKMENLISVIVPVYNVEPYLKLSLIHILLEILQWYITKKMPLRGTSASEFRHNMRCV